MIRRLARAALPVALFALPALAQAVELDGSGSLRADLWSGDRDLGDEPAVATASLWLRGTLDLGGGGDVVANAWARASTDDAGVAGRDPRQAQVRELYWRRSFGPVSLKVGRLMPAWGRADGFNPTDNLSPRDFTQLAPEDADLRFGNDGAAAEVELGRSTLSVHWFDDATSHRPPLEAVPGVRYVFHRPSRRSQWAVKWETAGDGYDGSLSYFDGHSLTPDLSPAGIGPGGFEVALDNHRARILGADLSMTRNEIVWRAELAWARFENDGADDLFRKKDQVWLVAGGERQLLDGTTVGLQLTVRHAFDHRDLSDLGDDPIAQLARRQAAFVNQTDRNQYGFTWRIARSLRNDTVRLETSGAALFPHDGSLVRAKVEVAIDDRLTFQAGLEHYAGRREGFLGQLRDNRLVYTQLRLGF